MALTYYSNWGTQVLDHQHLKQDQTTTNCENFFFPQDQLLSQDLLLPPELLNFHDNFDTCIDTLFTQNDHLFCSDENVDAYTAFTPSPASLDILPPKEIVEEDACFDHYPKRTKFQENCFFYPDMTIHDNYIGKYDVGFVPNPPFLPEFVLPELPMPPVFNEGSTDNEVKKAANAGGNLSQQSIAARIRRRKITEKTQELGKLIPGGQKMNTAEMFQAASKYIKFMQAQIGLLQLMQEENEEEMQSPELEALVTSPLVQEKLYSAEKCLVPKNFVRSLTQKPQLQSNPQLIKDLIKLI
ncbi:transcription factor bHLH52-like [Apium graveolens]|uniref:transcription factor bHLH52-like n=1 Tax=Apium graveolens TaxID=4045 RepID=UPI003D7B0A7A